MNFKKFAEMAAERVVKQAKITGTSTGPGYVLPYGYMVQGGLAGGAGGGLISVLKDLIGGDEISGKNAIASALLGSAAGAALPLGWSAWKKDYHQLFGPKNPELPLLLNMFLSPETRGMHSGQMASLIEDRRAYKEYLKGVGEANQSWWNPWEILGKN